jgi:hypothetical protein
MQVRIYNAKVKFQRLPKNGELLKITFFSLTLALQRFVIYFYKTGTRFQFTTLHIPVKLGFFTDSKPILRKLEKREI